MTEEEIKLVQDAFHWWSSNHEFPNEPVLLSIDGEEYSPAQISEEVNDSESEFGKQQIRAIALTAASLPLKEYLAWLTGFKKSDSNPTPPSSDTLNPGRPEIA